jgi:hypothetical protein
LASVLAAAAFAPEASAIPSFARQTGMACASCHQTHFPVLNGFGRAFKAAGYTMMGAQEKVEGEHLSIPAVLNASLLLKYRYQLFSGAVDGKTPGAGVTATTTEYDGQWQMGDEFSLFFGGRIAETEHFTIGFLNENNAAAGALAGLRVPVTFDLGAAKIQAIPFSTDALGAAYGFELSSGGVMRANRWNEMRRTISAIQYNADRGHSGSAAGFAVVLQNDMGYINVTKWSSSFFPGANGGGLASTNYGQNYVRAAVTPTIAGFDIVAGVGSESGASADNMTAVNGAGSAATKTEAKQTFADLQVHGDIAGMTSGIYAQYANAPACKEAGVACVHNDKTLDRTAFSIGGEMVVVPHTLVLSAAYRDAKTGRANASGASYTDKAVTVGAIYELTQNVELHANYVSYSGTEATRANKTSEFLGMLEAAW